MVSKSTISFIQSLKQKKYRQKYNKFILEGEKIIMEGINQNNINFDSIYCLPEKKNLLLDSKISITEINSATLQKISNLKTPPGIIAVANIPPVKSISNLKIQKLAIFLEDIQDPGNLGTILRTAEWFGFNDIILSQETVEVYNPKVIQASMGSFARMNYYYSNIIEIKDTFPQVKIIGTSLQGNNLFEFEPSYPMIMTIGSESHGISDLTIQNSDVLLSIPKAKNSGAESLNAAIANAVFLTYLSLK